MSDKLTLDVSITNQRLSCSGPVELAGVLADALLSFSPVLGRRARRTTRLNYGAVIGDREVRVNRESVNGQDGLRVQIRHNPNMPGAISAGPILQFWVSFDSLVNGDTTLTIDNVIPL